MYNSKFEEIKLEIEKLLSGTSEFSQDDIFQNIKDNNFLGSLSNEETNFLINMLPIDTSWVQDDGKSSYNDISKSTGGISLSDVGYKIYDPDEFDEFDLIQSDKKERKTGFGSMLDNSKDDYNIDKDDIDFLLDIDPDDEDDDDQNNGHSSGFLGLLK